MLASAWVPLRRSYCVPVIQIKRHEMNGTKDPKPSIIRIDDFLNNKLTLNLKIFSFFFSSGLNQQKYKVLEMNADGTLYLYRSSLLCVSDIIKRLTEGKFQMAESNMLLGTENT